MTESKSPSNEVKAAKPATVETAESDNPAAKTTVANTGKTAESVSAPRTGSSRAQQRSSRSVLSLLALLLAVLAITGSLALYYWQMQQHSALSTQLTAATEAQLTQINERFTQQLQQLQQGQQQQLSEALQRYSNESQAKIAELQQSVQRLSQRQPSDWLVQESEYLIRIAGRSLWLEKQPDAAIALLKAADQRLQQLNNSQYLPVRQAINNDIEQLQLLPKLETEQVLLSLMALNQQVNALPLAQQQHIASEQDNKLTPSDNIADWRSNLAKAWQRFLNDFITIRRRSEQVEPLLSPQQHANLRQNLMLKIELAQWAASQQKATLYQQTLTDIQQWLKRYFALDQPMTAQFIERVQQLQQQNVALTLPGTLSAIAAMQALHSEQRELPATNVDDGTAAKPDAVPAPANDSEGSL